MCRLTTLHTLDATQVDEPESISLGLKSLPQLLDTHRNRGVVSNQRQGRKHEDLLMAAGPMRARNTWRHFEASLATPTDQDLALDQEGDGLLDSG